MTNQPIEEKWKERLDDILYTVTGDCVSVGRNELKSFIENLLEQERKDDFKRGYEAGIEDFGTRHRPTTPEKKCERCGGSGIVSVPPKDWRTGADYEVAKCLNCQSK